MQNMNQDNTILAIDPGSAKCGLAVLDSKKNILHHEIVETKDFARRLILVKEFSVNTIALGNGTFSKEIKKIINETLPDINIISVGERNTTEAGKKLYFKYNPPKWFWRFIPISLQTPKTPYDDYAAVAIGIKYLEEK